MSYLTSLSIPLWSWKRQRMLRKACWPTMVYPEMGRPVLTLMVAHHQLQSPWQNWDSLPFPPHPGLTAALSVSFLTVHFPHHFLRKTRCHDEPWQLIHGLLRIQLSPKGNSPLSQLPPGGNSPPSQLPPGIWYTHLHKQLMEVKWHLGVHREHKKRNHYKSTRKGQISD